MSKKIQSILLIKDYNDDQLLFRQAFAEVDGTVRFIILVDNKNVPEKLSISSIFPDLLIYPQIEPILNFGLPATKTAPILL